MDLLKSFGRIYTNFKTAGTLSLALVLIIVGIIIIKASKHNYTEKVMAFINNIECSKRTIAREPERHSSIYDCTADANYIVDGKGFSTEIKSTNINSPLRQQNMEIYYDPVKPESSVVNRPLEAKYGVTLISLALVVAICTILWAIAVNKNTTLAGIAGGLGIVDILT